MNKYSGEVGGGFERPQLKTHSNVKKKNMMTLTIEKQEQKKIKNDQKLTSQQLVCKTRGSFQ